MKKSTGYFGYPRSRQYRYPGASSGVKPLTGWDRGAYADDYYGAAYGNGYGAGMGYELGNSSYNGYGSFASEYDYGYNVPSLASRAWERGPVGSYQNIRPGYPSRAPVRPAPRPAAQVRKSSGLANGSAKSVPTKQVPESQLSEVETDKTKKATKKPTSAKLLGEEFISKAYDNQRDKLVFTCGLCQCVISTEDMKEGHLTGKRHSENYKIFKRRQARPLGFGGVGAGQIEALLLNQYYGGRRGPVRRVARDVPAKPEKSKSALEQESIANQYLRAKHTQIYPTKDELQQISKIVTTTEKALKPISDKLVIKDSLVQPESSDTEKKAETNRILKALRRVGDVGKGLLLTGDTKLELAVVCTIKPTQALLKKVFEMLPKEIQTIDPESKYSVKVDANNAAIVISDLNEPHLTVKITFTSNLLSPDNDAKAENIEPDPADMLNKDKCVEALNAVKRTKWFQENTNENGNIVLIVRILKDLCRRHAALNAIDLWPLEVLTWKIIKQRNLQSPGEIFRLLVEIISAGILLPGGPGISDGAKDNAVDLAELLTVQQKENLTETAQHCLRMLVYRHYNKILGMDLLPGFKSNHTRPKLFQRKRAHKESNGTAEVKDGNDKKEGEDN